MENFSCSCYKYTRYAFRLCFIILNNLYCIPTYVMWMILLWPLRKIQPDLYWRLEGYIFHWLLAMVALWSNSAGYDVVEAGDDISKCIEERTLVIANHQSTADVPMLFACFNTRQHILPNIMWIMDSLFKYTNFGVVSILHKDFFIMSGKEKRDKSLQDLTNHILTAYIPLNRKWMVLFPEGGFLHNRKPISHKYAEKMNLPKFENVSLPRVGAMQVIMNTCGPAAKATNNNANNISKELSKLSTIEYILDITVGYPKGWPIDIANIVFGNREPCQTVFFYRLYHIKEVPVDSESLTKWLTDRWAEKEKMLQYFYDHGSFLPEYSTTGKPCLPRVVEQDYLRFWLLHMFFLASTYVHLQMIQTAYSYCSYLVY